MTILSLERPTQPEVISHLREKIRSDSEVLRRTDQSPNFVKRFVNAYRARNVLKNTLKLMQTDASPLEKVLGASEAAGNTGDPVLIELAQEKIEEAFPIETGNKMIDETHAIGREEFVTAIADTESDTFPEALIRAQEIVDSEQGFKPDEVTFTAVNIATNALYQRLQDEARNKRLANATLEELSEEDDAVLMDPNDFFDDEEGDQAA